MIYLYGQGIKYITSFFFFLFFNIIIFKFLKEYCELNHGSTGFFCMKLMASQQCLGFSLFFPFRTSFRHTVSESIARCTPFFNKNCEKAHVLSKFFTSSSNI